MQKVPAQKISAVAHLFGILAVLNCIDTWAFDLIFPKCGEVTSNHFDCASYGIFAGSLKLFGGLAGINFGLRLILVGFLFDSYALVYLIRLLVSFMRRTQLSLSSKWAAIERIIYWPYLSVCMAPVILIAFMMIGNAITGNGVINYAPSSFAEQPSPQPFFYSIGNKLKFGNVISEDAPTIFEGRFFYGTVPDGITQVFVSPDEKKAVLAGMKKLYLVEAGKPPVLILNNVDTSIEINNFKIGEVYYKPNMIQWDAHSDAIYIMQTIKRPIKESLTGKDASLIRIDIENPKKIIEVVTDFRAFRYFLVGDNDVCFDYAQDDGGMTWKCLYHGTIENLKSVDNKNVLLEDGTLIKDTIQYGSHMTWQDSWPLLGQCGFSLKIKDDPDKYHAHTEFYSTGHVGSSILATKGGEGWPEGGYADSIGGGSVLPGCRYAILDVALGELLVDGITGQYEELPAKTVVYRSLDTSHHENFFLRNGLAENPVKFLPDSKWQ